ncbi:uncharacterized protein HKW66_Vig0003620 [Vigna angularis]|uniref:Uncharacterized protein n=1 Tax=Phaseolus angularis TaxID=3914 RepID=A0A8T0LCE0_PHAAN|nr:uncharacterized protein HKW66_Vig0003620 [Vigna angularis]
MLGYHIMIFISIFPTRSTTSMLPSSCYHFATPHRASGNFTMMSDVIADHRNLARKHYEFNRTYIASSSHYVTTTAGHTRAV